MQACLALMLSRRGGYCLPSLQSALCLSCSMLLHRFEVFKSAALCPACGMTLLAQAQFSDSK